MPFQLNTIADGLLQSASHDYLDEHKSPERMSRQVRIPAIKQKSNFGCTDVASLQALRTQEVLL